jgi:hypothetical protein
LAERMRTLLLSCLCAIACACGGATDNARSAAAAAASEDSDPGFAEYAATHSIQTLAGGDSPEVTADGLRLEALDKERPVKLDGILSEWPAPAKASTVIKGATKAALKIGLQYDETKLYVGADVSDASFAVGRDHVSLVLAVPSPGGAYSPLGVDLYAGKPGESEGSVRFGRHGAVPGAKIVEAPGSGGYSFEATIPLASLGDLRTTRVGVRGFAAYVDGDGIVATGPSDVKHPASMAWIPSEPELSMIEQLLQPKGLTHQAPAAEVVADLTGDGMRERIAVYEHYLTICGASFLGGTGYFFRDLVGEVVKLEVRDATGRGKADVIVRRRQSVGDATREYLEIFSAMNNTEEPRLTFAHEIAVRQSDHHIDNAIRIARGEIEVSVEPPTNWDALSYREPIASDVEPILFPWGGVKSQTYRFDGSKFAKAKEVAQRETVPGAGARAATGDEGARLPPHPPEPPTPRVSRGGDLASQVLEQYRQDRGVGDDVAPKVDLKVHVAGDPRPERVVLIGRDLVVFGPGFKGGAGYAYITLQQFADPGDISDVSARDLTGDGAADLVVRGVRHTTSDEGSVDVQLMLVYQVKADGISRIFGIETAREQSRKRVQGLVQFVPAAGGKSFDILASPGRAAGWTEKTYPWAQDTPGNGNLEPLLLPWGGTTSVRYAWNGTQFVAK